MHVLQAEADELVDRLRAMDPSWSGSPMSQESSLFCPPSVLLIQDVTHLDALLIIAYALEYPIT
jgi:hypothetical protein